MSNCDIARSLHSVKVSSVVFLCVTEVALRGGHHREVAHAEVQELAEDLLQEENEESAAAVVRHQGEGVPLWRERVQTGQGRAEGTQAHRTEQRPA